MATVGVVFKVPSALPPPSPSISSARPVDSAGASRLHGRLENTYQTQPVGKVSPRAMRDVIQRVISGGLENRKYDPIECSSLAKAMANDIRIRVKEMGHPRYKYVVNVFVGQKDSGTIGLASRCVWHSKFDDYAEFSYKNESVYALGVVYALYLE